METLILHHRFRQTLHVPGRVAQSVGHLTQGSWVRYPVWQHTFVSPSAFSRRAVVSYWRKYVHEVLVNRLGGLSLPRKSVVRLTDHPDMTLDVYRGRKTTMQQDLTCLFDFVSAYLATGALYSPPMSYPNFFFKLHLSTFYGQTNFVFLH